MKCFLDKNNFAKVLGQKVSARPYSFYQIKNLCRLSDIEAFFFNTFGEVPILLGSSLLMNSCQSWKRQPVLDLLLFNEFI